MYINFKNGIQYIVLLVIVLLGTTSCYRTNYKTSYASYTNKQLVIDPSLTHDASIDSILAPRKKLLDSLMNVSLCEFSATMEKNKPNGSLNNFCADMLLSIGKSFSPQASASIINYGGLRLNSMSAGIITKGKIYELMPFDNMIVSVSLRGDTLLQVLDYIASQGGWPISGIRFKIVNNKAEDIFVNEQALVANQYYTIIMSDYLANGGDNLTMLRGVPQLHSGWIMREAFIRELKGAGVIIPNKEKRIQ